MNASERRKAIDEVLSIKFPAPRYGAAADPSPHLHPSGPASNAHIVSDMLADHLFEERSRQQLAEKVRLMALSDQELVGEYEIARGLSADRTMHRILQMAFAPKAAPVAPALTLLTELLEDQEKGKEGAHATQRHTLEFRRTVLDPVLDDVWASTSDKNDHVAMWNRFLELAILEAPPRPLRGMAGKEVQYTSEDGLTTISKKAFMARMKRRLKKRFL